MAISSQTICCYKLELSWAYELTDKFSIGVQPNINYSSLKLAPNPTASPTMAGYPTTNKASAIGFGAQFGLFYDSGFGLKLGASYKMPQTFFKFKFTNTYLDNTTSKNEFQMDYPGIFSLGLGYSEGDVDLAFDFRRVDYENTAGFTKHWMDFNSLCSWIWMERYLYFICRSSI